MGWFKNGNEEIDDKYIGQVKGNLPNGNGILTYHDGEKYVGEFKDGIYHGYGTFSLPYGMKYQGEWKDGKYHGKGIYTYPYGEEYIGEFKNGLINGSGTYIYPDGRKYVGKFEDEKYHGNGTLTLPIGYKYIGEWNESEPWNIFVYDNDGKILGSFVNGIEIVQGKGIDQKLHKEIIYYRKENDEWGWHKDGNEKFHIKYMGEIKNGVANGMGTEIFLEVTNI